MFASRYTALVIAYVLACPLISISVRYLVDHYEPYTLTTGRLLPAGILFLFYCLRRHREDCLRLAKSPKALAWLVLACVFEIVGQYYRVEALKETTATLFQLVNLLTIPFGIAAGALLFREERSLLSNPRFQIGTVVALAATVLAITNGGPSGFSGADINWEPMLGVLGFFFVILIVKQALVSGVSVIVIAIFMQLFAALLAVLGMVVSGEFAQGIVLEPIPLSILVMSGVYGMAVWILLELVVLRELGVVPLKVLALVIPVASGFLELAIFGSSLSMAEAGYGLVVIMGAAMALSCMSDEHAKRIFGFQLLERVRIAALERMGLAPARSI